MLNVITAMGRLGRDPEKRALPDGKSVTSFSIACDRDFKSKDGQRETDWLDVVCFGNTADFAAKYLTKGRTAIVNGRLQIRSWTDKDGNKRRNAEIVANNVYFGDSRESGDSGSFNAPQGVPIDREFPVMTDDDSELPF